ncbi:hypothetical protein [Staphylococcus saccharolyticus]
MHIYTKKDNNILSYLVELIVKGNLMYMIKDNKMMLNKTFSHFN